MTPPQGHMFYIVLYWESIKIFQFETLWPKAYMVCILIYWTSSKFVKIMAFMALGPKMTSADVTREEVASYQQIPYI